MPADASVAAGVVVGGTGRAVMANLESDQQSNKVERVKTHSSPLNTLDMWLSRGSTVPHPSVCDKTGTSNANSKMKPKSSTTLPIDAPQSLPLVVSNPSFIEDVHNGAKETSKCGTDVPSYSPARTTTTSASPGAKRGGASYKKRPRNGFPQNSTHSSRLKSTASILSETSPTSETSSAVGSPSQPNAKRPCGSSKRSPAHRSSSPSSSWGKSPEITISRGRGGGDWSPSPSRTGRGRGGAESESERGNGAEDTDNGLGRSTMLLDSPSQDKGGKNITSPRMSDSPEAGDSPKRSEKVRGRDKGRGKGREKEGRARSSGTKGTFSRAQKETSGIVVQESVASSTGTEKIIGLQSRGGDIATGDDAAVSAVGAVKTADLPAMNLPLTVEPAIISALPVSIADCAPLAASETTEPSVLPDPAVKKSHKKRKLAPGEPRLVNLSSSLLRCAGCPSRVAKTACASSRCFDCCIRDDLAPCDAHKKQLQRKLRDGLLDGGAVSKASNEGSLTRGLIENPPKPTGPQAKCKGCFARAAKSGCSSHRCFECCVRDQLTPCEAHSKQLQRKHREDELLALRPKVDDGRLPKGSFAETAIEDIGETVTLWCLMDFLCSKQNQSALKAHSRNQRASAGRQRSTPPVPGMSGNGRRKRGQAVVSRAGTGSGVGVGGGAQSVEGGAESACGGESGGSGSKQRHNSRALMWHKKHLELLAKMSAAGSPGRASGDGTLNARTDAEDDEGTGEVAGGGPEASGINVVDGVGAEEVGQGEGAGGPEANGMTSMDTVRVARVGLGKMSGGGQDINGVVAMDTNGAVGVGLGEGASGEDADGMTVMDTVGGGLVVGAAVAANLSSTKDGASNEEDIVMVD